MGKKRQPVYKIVAADSRAPRDGRIIEAIGLYNPLTEPATVNIKEERAEYWLGVGAQPTDTVKNLLSSKGILLKQELKKKKKTEEEINESVSVWLKEKEARLASKTKKAKKKKKGKEGENKTDGGGANDAAPQA